MNPRNLKNARKSEHFYYAEKLLYFILPIYFFTGLIPLKV
ncbi:putative membrane protein [Glaesserella parasuis D74]|nr:putative membrane protein [Glaesserella parasuis D74]